MSMGHPVTGENKKPKKVINFSSNQRPSGEGKYGCRSKNCIKNNKRIILFVFLWRIVGVGILVGQIMLFKFLRRESVPKKGELKQAILKYNYKCQISNQLIGFYAS